MKIIEPSVEILNAPNYQDMLEHIELAARTCYKSEHKISEGSAPELIQRLIKIGHHSVLEHGVISVRFICDRGVSHELVRHRLCSFSQESSRYCNYSGEKFGKEITFIKPEFFEAYEGVRNGTLSERQRKSFIWERAMEFAERSYLALITNGATPQEARSVLPNSLKTEIVVTANIRQWRFVFSQRVDKPAHPQMRQVMIPLLGKFIENYNVFFQDFYELYVEEAETFATKGWQLAEVR